MKKELVIEFIGSMQDGGAETLVKNYALMIDPNNIDLRILTLYPSINSANAQIIHQAGKKLDSIYPKRNLLYRFINNSFGEKYIKHKLIKYIRFNKPRCIHVHLELLHFLADISNYLDGIRLFYTCHSEPNKVFPSVTSREYLAAAKLIKQNNLQIIALHKDMQMDLNNMFGIDNVLVINNGIDFSRFQSAFKKTKKEAKIAIGLSEDSFVIGHVGRFNPVKNHLFLLDVFHSYYQSNNNSNLLLIGDGKTKEEVIKKAHTLGIDDRVIILSQRTDIPDLMRAMDVFVFPSLYEGLSLTLIEAQVMNLRCIISDSIKPDNVLSESTIQISLNKTPTYWADIIINQKIKNNNYGMLDNYDMRNIIKSVENLYLNS